MTENVFKGHVLLFWPTQELFTLVQNDSNVSSLTVIMPGATDELMGIDDDKTVVIDGSPFHWEPGFEFAYDVIYYYGHGMCDSVWETIMLPRYSVYLAENGWMDRRKVNVVEE